MSGEIEETMKRLVAHKGVQMAVIVNSDGIPIRTSPATMEHTVAVTFPAVLLPVVQKARQMIKALDSTNDFSAIRMRSDKNEIIVYPEKEYTLFVVQEGALV